MQPDQRDVAYLWDMLDAARSAIEFTRNKTLDDFVKDRMLQYAVERAVEIVGEAANRLSPAFQQAHPEIPWRKIVGQRNVLANEYGDVAPTMMWDLTRLHLPVLIQQLERLIPSEAHEKGFESLSSARAETLDALSAKLDGLLERMQTPAARRGMEAAFHADPAALGKAAAKAARRRR